MTWACDVHAEVREIFLDAQAPIFEMIRAAWAEPTHEELYKAAWREGHRESARASNRRWYEANKEEYNARRRERRRAQ